MQNRRGVMRGTLALAGGLALPGSLRAQALLGPAPPLVPMRLSPDQLIDLKCCIRPLRAAGPNLGTETVRDRLVIHNYGHGGSGWSLSWGSAEVAVGKALSVLPDRIAVVGCGIIGLTSAIVAQRAGLAVTIYARDPIQQTRSFRASGSFTPGSRIALAGPAGPQFPDQWEHMARYSWKMFRTMLGLPGEPVAFGDSYSLSDNPIERRTWPADPAIAARYETTGLPQQNSEFARLDSRIRDIVPQSVPLQPGENPFGTPYATRSSHMYFNFPAYSHLLMTEFLARGGRYEMRNLHSPADVGDLPERVVIHATGYAARDLWQDHTVIPVRGQTGWLVPQPGVNYSIRSNNMSAMAKADGIVIMNNNPDLGEMLGVGDSMELPNRAPVEEAMASLSRFFWPADQRGAA
ncbi:FAD-binding oxidoreductase [Altererythrobacter sp. KTW20L]|uniref:FAD-dependent oxidoreductase n=1 Tax=Altererythrobacter sp. KTW20L TaxID=2942210 RepID=UPI0020C1172F|nr:FAD-dependent oxidoreductase [Altererythrobacter sp. KTW20L]MCL6251578.1 FAD-binding oxidoreductase [Altererythrobacter sp. KTW20L]